jgi:hypothetical protein
MFGMMIAYILSESLMKLTFKGGKIMFKIKEKTGKRFVLAWSEIVVAPRDGTYVPSLGHIGSSSGVAALERQSFGGIEYALDALNSGNFSTPPDLAGVEGGPLSPLQFWFKED